MRRSPGTVVLAMAFTLFALNALAQVALALVGRSDDPAALSLMQMAIGLTSLAAARGSWTGARWAPVAALLYGLSTATMLVALGPLLDLPADSRGGLWVGAAAVQAFGLGAAWYLRRARRLATTTGA
jgi:hypothetical protein